MALDGSGISRPSAAPPQSRIELGRTAPFGVLAIDLLQQT
jgi:hypothetical protein